MSGRPTAADPRQDPEGKKVMKVLDMPGPPTQIVIRKSEWCKWWLLALLIMIPSCIYWQNYFYSATIISWDAEAEHLNFEAETEGCDILIQETDTPYSWAKLTYWKAHGTGSLKKDGKALKLNAKMNRKVMSFRCILRLELQKQRGAHFENASITMNPDLYAEAVKPPSTMDEIVALKMVGLKAADNMYVKVDTVGESYLRGISAKHLSLEVYQGMMTVAENLDQEEQLAKKVTVTAKDGAVVSMSVHTSDVKLAIADDTMKTTSLAAHSIVVGDEFTTLSKSGVPSGEHINLHVEALHSPFYLLTADKELVKAEASLSKTTGDLVKEGPALLPQGKRYAAKLADWLTDNQNEKFMIYFHFPFPNAPTTTTRLMSTPAYKAFSVELFSMISVGMLTPEIFRMEFPIVGGFDFLWPYPKEKLSAIEEYNYSMGVFNTISQEVDINKLGIPKAKWTYDPKGPACFVYDFVPDRHHANRGGWKQRPLGYADTGPFLVASAITVGLSIIIGIIVCCFLWYVLRPHLFRKLRKSDLFNANSYRLIYEEAATDWNPSAAFVNWPKRGVYIRWAKRANIAGVSTMTFEAHSWPGSSVHAAIEKVDPWRIPDLPDLTGQQVFLFGSDPVAKPKPEIYMDKLDQTLWGTWTLCAGGKRLQPGTPMCFRIVSFTAAGKVLEKSAWTRPVMIEEQRSFAEYPLLLWKAFFPILPQDTFQHFLDTHCLPISTDHAQTIEFTDMKLALVNDSDLFCGAFDTTYGDELNESLFQKVRLVVSTGGDIQDATDDLYTTTQGATLPTNSSNLRTGKYLLDYKQAVPGVQEPSLGLAGAKFIIVDMKAKEDDGKMKIEVNEDTDQIVRFDVQVETGTTNFTINDNTARYETTWGDLLQILHHKENSKLDQLVLRDGMAPVAALTAKFSFTNREFGKHKPSKAEYSQGFPNKVFSKLSPGQVYQWGQVLTLMWEWKDVTGWDSFDLVMESEPLYGTKRHNVPEAQWVPSKMRETLLRKDVKGKDGSTSIVMAPDQPYDVNAMMCRILLRHSDPAIRTVIAKSPEILIDRPITLGDLELAYCAYCVRNCIPMVAIPKDKASQHGIRVLEREFFLVQGYRAPLTTPFEVKFIAGDKKMDGVIKNGGSDFITNGNTMNVYDVEKTTEATKAGGGTPKATSIESPPAPPPVKSEMPVRAFMDMPTNVFWRRGISWNEDLLLWYSMAPGWAQENTLATVMETYEFYVLAKCANVFAYVCRVVLKVLTYDIQLLVLSLPAIIVFGIALQHDELEAHMLPEFSAGSSMERVYMSDFAMDPTSIALFDTSRWNLLNRNDRWVVRYVLVYVCLGLVAVLYCSFLEGKMKMTPVFDFLNGLMMFLWGATVFVIILYISLMCVWVILGALINPDLIPIAIGIIGVIVIARSQWSNLKMVRDQVESIIYTKLDLALHAIMDVFVGPEDSEVWMDMKTQKQIGGQICELLRDSEREITKQLLEQSTIKTTTDQDTVDRIKLLRNSAMFKQCVEGCPPNEILGTDFVPAEILKSAQEIANYNADLYKKRQFNSMPPYQAWDSEFTEHALSKALAMRAESFVPAPGQISGAEQTELDEISKNMHLSKETCQVIFRAFVMSVHLATTSENAVLKDVWSIAPMMSTVRVNQLFKHFLPAKKGEPSTAQRYLIESQQSEMEKYDAIIASQLTKVVDWQGIGRTIVSFVESQLYKIYTTRAVQGQLNACVDGSAAFQVMGKAYDLIYEKWDTYKKSPTGQWKCFVDLGLITEEYAKNPETQGIINMAVDCQRYYDGSIDQQSLIKAVKHMILERQEGANAPEFPDPMYLWYDALVRILKDLGWSEDEMEESWLKHAWDQVTDGQGIFRYRDAIEINQLIQVLSDDGLWKAAMKCLMKLTKIYGYAPCDPLKLGKKEAAKQAHTLEWADMTDLKWINEHCDWPAYIDHDIWKKHARKSHFGGPKSPIFLPMFQADDFLADLVYSKEADPKDAERKFTPLYAYPDDPMDLMWLLGDDGLIWHDLPDGKRPLRGIWMELALAFFDAADTIPSDLDVFFDCIEWQIKNHNVQVPWLRHNLLRRWILDVYIPSNTKTVSCQTFMRILGRLNVSLPEDVVKAEIFTPCPLVPDDDNGELRYITDLAAALRLWMGYGLWKEGIAELVTQLLPRGPVRNMAMKMLPEEFQRMDDQETSNGIVQPAQALVLLHKLAHPGLTAKDLVGVVHENLNMECPERQIHHYFALMDVNGDGVMGVGEFVPTMRLIMVDYFPGALMEHMNLTMLQIVMFITVVILAVVFLLLCIQLVIKTFTSGTGVASAIHSGFNACTVAFAHVQANASGGFDDSVSSIRAWMHTVVFDAIVAVLGLSKPVVDKLAGAIAQTTK